MMMSSLSLLKARTKDSSCNTGGIGTGSSGCGCDPPAHKHHPIDPSLLLLEEDNEKESKLFKNNTKVVQRAKVLVFLLLMYCVLAMVFMDPKQESQSSSSSSSSSLSLLRQEMAQAQPQLPQMLSKPQEQEQQLPFQSNKFSFMSMEELQVKIQDLDQQVRQRKAVEGVLMETDPQGLLLTKELQAVTYQMILKKFDTTHFRIKMDLTFPKTIPDYDIKGPEDELWIQLAPPHLIPCSVYYFLELARTYKGGSFHRNAAHVLQAYARSSAIGQTSMPFQEYNALFPHTKGTTGYAGRPSGPGWYVSIEDNTKNHGPGSQQEENPYEADSLFGFVLKPGMDTVVPRIHSIPQTSWLSKENEIHIDTMTIYVPRKKQEDTGDSMDTTDWIPWIPPPTQTVSTL